MKAQRASALTARTAAPWRQVLNAGAVSASKPALAYPLAAAMAPCALPLLQKPLACSSSTRHLLDIYSSSDSNL